MNALELTQILANISAVVAAIGVILSLVYLSAQVRDNSRLVSENTKAQLMAADMTSNDGSREMAFDILSNPELAELVLKGLRGESLGDVDRYRFRTWIRTIVESHMTFYVQVNRDTVTDEIFQYWSRVFDGLFKVPSVVEAYQHFSPELPERFRVYMDAKIATPEST